MAYFVYLLANRPHGVLYCGVTNDLLRRVWEHKVRRADGFTRKYNVDKLVWYERHGDIMAAIAREKRIKRWRRAWKDELIAKHNSDWRDLYVDVGGTLPDAIIPKDRRAWKHREY